MWQFESFNYRKKLWMSALALVVAPSLISFGFKSKKSQSSDTKLIHFVGNKDSISPKAVLQPIYLDADQKEHGARIRFADSVYFSDFINHSIVSDQTLKNVMDGKHYVYSKGRKRWMPTKPAMVAMDDRGNIIHSLHSDQASEIASLTKIVSLHVVFDALDKDEIKLDDPVRISRNASNKHISTSRMYGSRPKRGKTYSVEKMIEATWGVSSNTAITALAEHISGSEEKFVARMNQTLRDMGYHEGQFYNVTGLNDRGKNWNRFPLNDLAEIYMSLVNHRYGDLIQTTTYTPTGRRKPIEHPAAHDLSKFIKDRRSNKTGYYSNTGYWHGFIRNSCIDEPSKNMLDLFGENYFTKDKSYIILFGGVSKSERKKLTIMYNNAVEMLSNENRAVDPTTRLILKKGSNAYSAMMTHLPKIF